MAVFCLSVSIFRLARCTLKYLVEVLDLGFVRHYTRRGKCDVSRFRRFLYLAKEPVKGQTRRSTQRQRAETVATEFRRLEMTFWRCRYSNEKTRYFKPPFKYVTITSREWRDSCSPCHQ